MAHINWCGNPCADCVDVCTLDESIPCSPDCENLFPDGSYNIAKCINSGCDAIMMNHESYEQEGDFCGH